MKYDTDTKAMKNEREQRGGRDLRERQTRAPPRAPRAPRPKTAKKKEREKHVFAFKLFGKWDPVEVADPSLRGYVNVEARMLPRSEGTTKGKFYKSKVHIVERLALKLIVSGHTGKKHRLTSGKFGGAYSTALRAVEDALTIIEQKEKKNPLEVLVKAMENTAVREEVISYQLGSIIAREAVITSPQRRVDKTLRFIAQNAYKKSIGNRKKVSEALAEELIAAAKGSADSFAMKEKERLEREASGAR
jgi:small subunit ribosomal protein S7